MAIILFKGHSEYGVLPLFIDELAKGFKARGYDVIIDDLMAHHDIVDVGHRLRTYPSPELVFTFNILGGFHDDKGRNVSEITGAPHVVQLVDHPLTPGHMLWLDKAPATTALLLIDQRHVSDLVQTYGKNRFSYIGFSAHAGVGKTEPMPEDAAHFVAERPIKALFSAGYIAPTETPWSDIPAKVKPIFVDAADLALFKEDISTLDAIYIALAARGITPLSHPELCQQLGKCAAAVEGWLRCYRRRQFLAAAARVGLPLALFGKGYGEAESYRGFQFGGPVDFTQTMELMRRSQITFNATIFGHGSHERPPSAMLAGSVAASSYSTYFAKAFIPDKEITLFRWLHLDEDLARIRDLLDAPETLFTIAKAGQEKAQQEHRWANRIDAILVAADASRQRLMAQQH